MVSLLQDLLQWSKHCLVTWGSLTQWYTISFSALKQLYQVEILQHKRHSILKLVTERYAPSLV